MNSGVPSELDAPLACSCVIGSLAAASFLDVLLRHFVALCRLSCTPSIHYYPSVSQ